MAASWDIIESYELGGMHCLFLRATADAATAVYTFPHAAAGSKPPKVLGITNPVKTTGTASQITAVYSESAGNLTIGALTAADVIEFTVFTGSA